MLDDSPDLKKQERRTPVEEVKEGPGGSHEVFTEDGSEKDPRSVAGDNFDHPASIADSCFSHDE